jgi:O-methyltransferase involved in polyketide biosynthesis
MTTAKVHFTEEQSTNLATLYGRAIDATRPDPLLGDQTAPEAVAKIDYDFRKFGMTTDMAVSVAARAKEFDDMTRAYLAAHPDAIVLHLGCGMDSRVFRVDPPPTVDWYDIDYPDVIELRRQVYPDRPHCTMVGSSVTDLGWLDQVPHDRPALVVAEGLTMYLYPDEGRAMLRAIAERMPSGEMMFDTFSRSALKAQKLNAVVRKAKATLHWGIDDPAELEELGLTLVARYTADHWATPELLRRISPVMRFQFWLVRVFPVFRNVGQVMHFRF